MKIQGWGRYPKIKANVAEPTDVNSLAQMMDSIRHQSFIVRGGGRSYGDSALSNNILSTRFFDHFLSFDEESGVLHCGSGVTFEQILRISIPKGWILPVLPGTRFVSVGGAIASDIHGKNHHQDGCFSNFVASITLMLATGETVKCSMSQRKNLFRATCGGMGLTGFILNAKIQLLRINSSFIDQHSVVAQNLEEAFETIEENQDSTYSVAWLDCMAKGDNLGRSIVFLGEHADENTLDLKDSYTVSAPPSPGFLLNRFSMGAFNSAYFNLCKRRTGKRTLQLERFFFPLDRIRHWNRLYGKSGFLQYQFVLPTETAREGMTEVLKRITEERKGSFLTVLKKMGAESENFLSFPMEGYTLALDFKYTSSLLPFLDQLDEVVLSCGGRIYLTKDARMNEATFKQAYPRWEKFMKVRDQVDPDSVFASLQSARLGLSGILKTENEH